MKLPVIKGIIDRRILLNFRIDPDILSKVLPNPFKPKLFKGMGVAGICLIRFKKLRPSFCHGIFGVSSENAAHRIAVEWLENGMYKQGVYIPRRDSNSWINAIAGGRLFPGVQHYARFKTFESNGFYKINMKSIDGKADLIIEAEMSSELSPFSVFQSIQEASDFFKKGSLGMSPIAQNEFDAVELCTSNWNFRPLMVRSVKSSFFDDTDLFPPGSVLFDSAFLMTGIDHKWISHKILQHKEV